MPALLAVGPWVTEDLGTVITTPPPGLSSAEGMGRVRAVPGGRASDGVRSGRQCSLQSSERCPTLGLPTPEGPSWDPSPGHRRGAHGRDQRSRPPSPRRSRGLQLRTWQFSFTFFFFFEILFYLFIYSKTDTEREAETSAEGEADSLQGARCRTDSGTPGSHTLT